MLSRCYNPNDNSYRNYGGRGIVVCKRWHLFVNFRDDMLETWFSGATIERIDNDASYYPDNCTWVTRAEQSRNRRPSTRWTFNGLPRAGNVSGVRSVSWDKTNRKWVVMFREAGKNRNLGRFKTIAEAKAVYDKARMELRGT